MRETFIEKRFTAASTLAIERCNTIIAQYRSQGYDLSLRQLYYQLVSRNWLANVERSYKNLSALVTDARMAGLMDWDVICDRNREPVTPPRWSGASAIVRACAEQFRMDRWKGQRNYVEVMVEKQALEGVLIPVCSELDVTFTANKGYSSASAMYDAAKRMARRAVRGQNVVVIYLGDHDPSGIDMTRDVLERLRLMSDCHIEVNRIALNMPQIEAMEIPENPAKMSDPRANEYVARFGRSSWELDAIEPGALAELVRTSISKYRDDDRYHECLAVEEAERQLLVSAAGALAADSASDEDDGEEQ